MLKRLEYPILYVSDVSQARDFYVAVLGCRVEDDLGDFVELSLGDSRLALNAANGPDKRPGFQTILVTSSDLDAEYSRISAAARIGDPLQDTPYGRTFSFLDPDGNKIEVVEG